MKLIRYAVLALALAAGSAAHAAPAQKWRPADADSDAFVRAYAFTVMEALMDEALAVKVDTGKITPAVAACLRKNIQLDNLYRPLRPYVASTFTSQQSLAQATAFFMSPTGIKMKKFGAQQLRNALRQSSGAPRPVAAAEPALAATAEDAATTHKFAESQAGKDFNRFVVAGLSHLGEVDVFGDAAAKCVHDNPH